MRKYSALFVFFLSAFTVQAQNFSNGQAARAVLGQQNFTAGNPSPSQVILGGVSGLAYYNGMLYVADSNRVAATPNDSRIVAFQTGQIPGLRDDVVLAGLTNTDCYLCGFPSLFTLGQSSFTPTDLENSVYVFDAQRSQTGMANATGVATDGNYFAVADTDNNRVLLWNEVPTRMNQPADLVLGQPDFTTFQTPAASFASSTSMRGPQGVWIQNGKLFVADTQNNRVLIWNTIPTHNNQAADLVLGQSTFNTNTQPAPSATTNPVAAANQLLNPSSVTSDGTRLYVSDLGFNRVLIWNSIPTAMDQNADVAVGQPDMVSTAANNPVVCAGHAIGPVAECRTSLNYPRFALSNGTKLFVADGGNDRVLVWDTIPTTNGALADEVLGEPDFIQDVVSSASISIASTAIDNTGGVDLVPTPQSLAYDGTNLYVSDAYNRRVLVYTPGDNPLPPDSVVNWASEIVRQEGIIQFTLPGTTNTIAAGDTVTVTIAGTAYTYTAVKNDTLDTIAQGVVKLINASDPNVTALFAGTDTGTVYLSSKATNLAYDAISLAATTSNSSDELATASGDYLSAGTAATGATGMIVEINGTNLSDQTVNATLDGTATIPNTLGGVQVYMDGYGCPILKASPTQIVTQIPYTYADRNSTSVYVRTVHNDGSVTVTNAMPVYIAPANPGIFNAPVYSGQPRPWPIAMAYHQPGNATAVVSIDGSVTAANIATITIQGVAYSYTVVAADTLLSITQNLIKLINASDKNVTASLGGAFTRVVLTAKQAGSVGYGITVTGTVSTSATVTVTAYTSITCCVVTPGSLITTSNPAGPGELITISGVGLGLILDESGNSISTLGTGDPYNGVVPNTAQSFVTATIAGTDAQTIFAELPTGSYGTYNMQIVVPPTAATSSAATLNVAQNAFISNTVTLPVGPTVVVPVTTTQTAPPTNIREVIDAPASGATVSGTILASGWALNTTYSLTGVVVSIDGQFFQNATVGNVRTDVCAAFTSPNCPGAGWTVNLDTTLFADGQHNISITASSSDGSSYTIAQPFTIANSGTPALSAFHANIDSPSASLSYRGATTFSGWAINANVAIASVNIYIDGAKTGTAVYGAARPDVCAIYGCSNGNGVGWAFQFNTSSIADGSHTLAAQAVSVTGQAYTISQTFQVQNWTGVSSTSASIDSPSATAGVFRGTMAIGGWALDHNALIASVDVSVDGVSYGAAAYGGTRNDVCTILPGVPGCPDVGFNASIDTTLLADGAHTLTIIVNALSGQSSTFTRQFSVQNSGSAANPVLAIIDQPANGASVSGVFTASGWALSTTDKVTSVQLRIDGKSYGNAAYAGTRADVCALYPASPNCPIVGWSASLDSGQLANGNHVLEATVTTASGYRASISTTFAVANASTGPGHISFDIPGVSTNPFLGSVVFSGWAINDNTTVSSLSVTIDGVPYGAATYGLPRADVCAVYPGRANCPGVGWSFGINTTQLTDGTHTLGITENNIDGTFSSSSIPFTVANYSTANPMNIHLDSPIQSTTVPIFGTINVAGWAVDTYSQVSAISVAIDGVPVGNATYGAARADVCSAIGGYAGCPNVGFNFLYDTTMLPNGVHTLAVTGITAAGQGSTVTEQFSVAN